MLIFWTFAFPLILGTLFYLAFSDIAEKESFKAIDIAVVEDKNIETNDILVDAFDSLSDETSDEKLFNTKYITEDEAKKLLEDDEITGYFVVADEPRIVIKANGINETIFKFSAEQIMQTTDMIEAISEEQIAQKIKAGDYNIDAEQIYNEGLQIAQKEYKNIKQEENKNLDYMMIEFYTLIAMTCLYGATIGLYAVNRALPNMGTKGMRMAVSPTQKSKLIISSACASFVVQVIGIAILFIYTIFALDVDYGENILLVVVLALLGCLAGLTLGIAIAALLKTSENTKIGIVIGFTMLCSFLQE